MGRTIATFHQLIEQAQARFAPYRRALRREDQRVLDELFARAKYYAASGSMEAGWEPLEVIFLSLFVEQQKTLRAQETCLRQLTERLRALEFPRENDDGKRLAARPLPHTGGDGAVDD